MHLPRGRAWRLLKELGSRFLVRRSALLYRRVARFQLDRFQLSICQTGHAAWVFGWSAFLAWSAGPVYSSPDAPPFVVGLGCFAAGLDDWASDAEDGGFGPFAFMLG
jgi:hypothetical protein